MQPLLELKTQHCWVPLVQVFLRTNKLTCFASPFGTKKRGLKLTPGGVRLPRLQRQSLHYRIRHPQYSSQVIIIEAWSSLVEGEVWIV